MIQARPEIFVSSIIPKVRESWLIRRLSPNTKYLCAGTLVVVKKSSNVKSEVSPKFGSVRNFSGTFDLRKADYFHI